MGNVFIFSCVQKVTLDCCGTKLPPLKTFLGFHWINSILSNVGTFYRFWMQFNSVPEVKPATALGATHPMRVEFSLNTAYKEIKTVKSNIRNVHKELGTNCLFFHNKSRFVQYKIITDMVLGPRKHWIERDSLDRLDNSGTDMLQISFQSDHHV